MKKITIFFSSSIYIILLYSFLLYSFLFSAVKSINYIESSSGLQTISFEGGRSEIEMVDINEDGYKDLISIGDHGSPHINSQEHGIMVWFGNGTGSNWTVYQHGDFGYGGIAAGDVNNDGKIDVGYGMHHDYSNTDLGDQIFEVALGDGTGENWIAWDDSLATQGETWGMFTTDFGDVDNDGLLDVGSISFGCCAGVHVYKNLGMGTWRQTFGFIGGNSQMEFSFGDINNDGNLDLVVSHQYGAVYFGDGSGNFILRHYNLPPSGNLGLKGISQGDVDNDGGKDIAFIGNSGSVNVWKWNNNSQQWDNLSTGLPATSSFSATLLYDMSVDGNCDLVLFGAGNLTIFAGNGGTGWTQTTQFNTPPNGTYEDITAGDADNNGFPDLIVFANEGSGFNTVNKLRHFKETSPQVGLSITPVFPKGKERFKINGVRFIEWLSSAPQTPVSKVKIELSSTGNSGPWILIADSLPNNGTYQWKVPASVNSSNCFLKMTVFNDQNSSTSLTPNSFVIGNLVGINEQVGNQTGFKLDQNYPNPFNPNTVISYQLSASSIVSLKVYDILGSEVATLVNEKQNAGSYEVGFNARLYGQGSEKSSGVYFYLLNINGNLIDVKSMILLK